MLLGIIAKEIRLRDNKDSFALQTIVEEYIDTLIRLKNDDELGKAFDKFLSLSTHRSQKNLLSLVNWQV